MSTFGQLPLLIRLAVRSIWAHKVKSFIVGSLMAFGSFLVVSGIAMLDSLEDGMSKSIIHSLAGHLQVYSADAKDELSVYGGTAMAGSEVGKIDKFVTIRRVIEKVPNVKAVVPMGINVANMTRGSDLDRLFAKIREAHRNGESKTARALFPKAIRMLKLLRTDVVNRIAVSDEEQGKKLTKTLRDVDRVLGPNYEDTFFANPLEELEFLDSKIASVGGEGRLMYLRYVGTDFGAFSNHFDRFKLVRGQMPKPGERGILINQRFADKRLKLLGARLLDALEKGRKEGLLMASNSAMKVKQKQLATQSAAISLMLSPEDTLKIKPKLEAVVGIENDDFETLLLAFLNLDDSNLAKRYAFFYEEIAPRIEIYPFTIGGVLTIRAYTKSGYVKAVNVKVHGTFSFKGLESSDLSGAANLVDLITFRELYGEMSQEQRAELKAIRKEVGARAVSRKTAEADLFGGADEDDSDSNTDDSDGFSEFEGVNLKRERRSAKLGPAFTQADIDNGIALSAAIILEDDDRLEQTRLDIEKAMAQAGLNLKVVDWRNASGFIGQLALAIRGILYIAIFIIFGVSLVIINNSMLMATLERIREIGTLRAIGAQRQFVMAMILLETVILCLVSGVIGAGIALGVISWLNIVGIPAVNDILVFVFSGSRLHPDFTTSHIMTGIIVIFVVSFLATFFPARTATRVQPIEAMQSRD